MICFILESLLPKREHLFNLRLNDREYKILNDYAKQKSLSASEVLRDYIKSLEQKMEPQS